MNYGFYRLRTSNRLKAIVHNMYGIIEQLVIPGKSFLDVIKNLPRKLAYAHRFYL